MRKRIIFLGLVLVIAFIVLIDQMFWDNLNQVEQNLYSAEAQRACLTQKEILPPHAFLSDGCSFWPNSAWTECCLKHDYMYWCGGDTSQRLEADRELRTCVNAVASGMGTIMYPGVRAGGAPLLPTSFRWGYGYPWPEY